MPYVPAQFNSNLFNCPLCNGYTEQTWYSASAILNSHHPPKHDSRLDGVHICFCKLCDKYTIWVDGKMIYPLINGASLPHQDMPKQVKDIYEEARGIMSRSPRSACALLRVGLEMLIDEIVGKNKNTLSDNISFLINEKRLPIKIQKSMDILRIIGNAVLHPNTIDLENKDDYQTAKAMFELLNIVTEELITTPKKIDDFYDNLPQQQRDAIEKRNGLKQ